MSTTTYTVDLGILGEIDALVTYEYSPPQSGKYSGPPEDCYPDEDAELTVTNVQVPGMTLSQELISRLVEMLDDDDSFFMMVLEEETEFAQSTQEDLALSRYERRMEEQE